MASACRKRWYYDALQKPQHSDELMRQFLGGAATDLSALVLAFPFLLYLWPMSLFLIESQPSRHAAALADRNRRRLAARHQAARRPDAVALRPRHNAGVMVAAGLGRLLVWGR